MATTRTPPTLGVRSDESRGEECRDGAGSGADGEPRGEERREFERVMVDLEVDYRADDTYLFAFITDISAMGIFVRTNAPETPGTRLNLRFTPQGGSTFELEGEVIWINPLRPSDGESDEHREPGMGVQFVNLDGDQRAQVLELVRTFAYLNDPKEDHKDRQ